MADPATQSEANELIEFLNRTRSVFRAIVEAREVLFRKQVRDLINTSYVDIEKEIEVAISTLQGPSFPATELGNAGLSGAQLSLKLNGFNRVYDRFVTRGTLRLLDKVLNWINKILGSLISAIPGAEPIKEFKEAVEEELDDSDPI